MRIPALFLIPACLLYKGVLAQSPDTIANRYASLILAERMSKNLHVLASDEYEGRETGQPGQKKAAAYIANQFNASGIQAYNGDYFQVFPLNLIEPNMASVKTDGKEWKAINDYYNFPGLAEQTITANSILFLGYGIEDASYNDYAGTDIKGRVVMIMGSEPFKDSLSLITKKRTPSVWSTYGKAKTEKAREKGAVAVLMVVDDLEKSMQDNRHKLTTPSMKLDAKKKDMPVIYISRGMADAILGKTGITALREKIGRTGKPQNREIRCDLKIDVTTKVQQVTSENVLGYVEGTDLKDELIIITAHYDHLGKEGEVVYNGADDDGSGTVAVIELANAFAKAKQEGRGPRRSMLFMAVSGEEKGLLGSAYYVENPVFPLAKTVCNLNIDMIGRVDERHSNGDYIYLIGSDKLSSELHRISEEANKSCCKLELDYTYNDEKDRNRFYYRSDHYNFAKNGIPVIFYFNGVHEDYHKESDEVEKIDFKKMEKITRLVFYTAWELAGRDKRIVVDSNKK